MFKLPLLTNIRFVATSREQLLLLKSHLNFQNNGSLKDIHISTFGAICLARSYHGRKAYLLQHD
uniref:Uncharacterized protein n=1 Tax=Salix viminalis TaxID=40686 RepID=A0A6N2KB66_SALVM